VGSLRTWLCVPLLLGGCQSWNDAHLRSSWATLQQAEDETARLEAARELCQHDTTRAADLLADHLGAFVGSDAEAYLAVAVAKGRDGGFQWLSRRIYDAPLHEAFTDAFDAGSDAPARLDWPALADALERCAPDSPEADRWLALLALADDGESSNHVREALGLGEEESPLRRRIRDALDHADMPRVLPPAFLSALGAPRDEAESEWLLRRYRLAFEDSLEEYDVWNDEAFVALSSAWAQAFPDDEIPLPEDDRELAGKLSALGAGELSDEDFPSFREAAAFMLRHHRSGWARLVELYAEAEALPSNALSYACRASARECIEVLQGGSVNDIASAADVAPALDLKDGEIALNLGCGSLPEPEARQLVARGFGSGMPLRIRQAAVACLQSLGDDVSAQWRELLPEAIAAHQWSEAEMIAAVAPELIDDTLRTALIASVKRGEIRAVDIPTLIAAADEGAELVRQGILALDPDAFEHIRPGAIRSSLAPIAEHVRNPPPPGRLLVFDGTSCF
jgi:hypothetical protein